MLRIESLSLPDRLPDQNVIESSNYNDYDPEFWEFQYELNPYLRSLSDKDLIDRYKSILKNMELLLSKKREIIPIQSFLSSWYWFRKEHQNRLEVVSREIEPHQLSLDKEFYSKIDMPINTNFPNSGNLLFRYGQKIHLEPMLKKGSIRINPATTYSDQDLEEAQMDKEQVKSSFIPNHQVAIRTKKGEQIKTNEDIKKSVSASNYYMLCLSCDWLPYLFSAFKADSCIVIKDPKIFTQRLKSVAKEKLKDWYSLDCPVEYFDPHEIAKDHFFSATMSKNFKFAYQQEYRFLWDGMEKRVAEKGQTGIVIILVAAVFSTASAILATIFAISRLAKRIADDGQLPHQLTERRRSGVPVYFALLMAALAIVVQFFGNLEQITTFSSLVFLFVFSIVNFMGHKHKVFTGWKRFLPVAGSLGCASAAGVLLYDIYTAERTTLYVVMGISIVILLFREAYIWFHARYKGSKN